MVDDVLAWLNRNFFWLFVAAFVAQTVWGAFRGLRRRARAAVPRHLAEAEALAAGRELDEAHPALRSEAFGDYTGKTDGVFWELKARHTVDTEDGPTRTTSGRCLWRTEAAAWPAGRFLLLMDAPGYQSSKFPLERTGLLNRLALQAGELALDAYVAMYFDSKYAPLVNIGQDGVKVERPALDSFLILTNEASLAEDFLDDATVTLIASWRQDLRAVQVNNVGILFCPDGLLVACAVEMTGEQQAREFSELGAALARRMEEAQRGPRT